MKKGDIAYDGEKVEWNQRHIHSANSTIGQVSYNLGGYCGPRVQRDFELVMLSSGSCTVTIDQTTFPLQIDKVYLFTPGHHERFVFSETQKSRHFWCSMTPSSLSRELRRALLVASENALTPSECFHRIISSAFMLSITDSAEAQQVVDLLATALFAEFLHLEKHDKNQPDLVIRRVLRHMEDHFADETCLLDAKRLSRYSDTAFICKFKSVTGQTPSRYLWQLRAEKGIQFLSETGLSISEIAYQCGFKNPFHFSRSVRRIQGISPRLIRQSAWK